MLGGSHTASSEVVPIAVHNVSNCILCAARNVRTCSNLNDRWTLCLAVKRDGQPAASQRPASISAGSWIWSKCPESDGSVFVGRASRGSQNPEEQVATEKSRAAGSRVQHELQR